MLANDLLRCSAANDEDFGDVFATKAIWLHLFVSILSVHTKGVMQDIQRGTGVLDRGYRF